MIEVEAENEPVVSSANLVTGVHRDLSLTALILGKRARVKENPGAKLKCEVWTLILIPAN
jgi:hypothetical protein